MTTEHHGVVKIDVEGFEDKVLEGMTKYYNIMSQL